MNKTDALESIKEAWEDKTLSLGEKIIRISNDFYAAGLDVSATAAYIHTTESELDSMLALGEFDDEIISKISEVNPPKTTWTVLSSASDEEVEYALGALGDAKRKETRSLESADAYVYHAMIEVSGPTVEQKVANLSGDTLRHVLKKAEDFGTASDWERKFVKSIAAQKKRGKVLSDKQIKSLVSALNKFVDNGVIKHDSIDGDQDICDEVLEALDR